MVLKLKTSPKSLRDDLDFPPSSWMAVIAQMELKIRRVCANDSVRKRREAGMDLGSAEIRSRAPRSEMPLGLIEQGETSRPGARDLGMSRSTLCGGSMSRSGDTCRTGNKVLHAPAYSKRDASDSETQVSEIALGP